ncbi:tRNA pseudouridine synthase A [Chlamydia trachomatis]|nr:tRNA pseudouridine synthase A [Chlamydia trachomatis]
MKTIGHPIVGDVDYGNQEQPKNVVRTLLHAASLAFISPFSNEKIEVSSLTPSQDPYPFYADFSLKPLKKPPINKVVLIPRVLLFVLLEALKDDRKCVKLSCMTTR